MFIDGDVSYFLHYLFKLLISLSYIWAFPQAWNLAMDFWDALGIFE